ncbi:hypothetical protein SAMN05421827_13915 [Pedobacter terrae]|uniref:Uncharacterized protein n=1 Tax=Pedobacter terrae TaxID=405671 RepID=A0A1G8EIY8_9SPHI|nr:hypothetical protein SAMN05421827_13915 [Pedobacter terrae]
MVESGFDSDISTLQILEILMDAKSDFLSPAVNQYDKDSFFEKQIINN